MRPVHLAGVLLAVVVAPAAGQTFPVRTAPIAQADRFEIFPSRYLGMGGLSIAVTDSTGDLWWNPATGARVEGTRFVTAPVFYRVTENSGAGRALPFGVVTRSGDWFAAGALALQSVTRRQSSGFFGPVPVVVPSDGDETDARRASPYAFALLGRAWPERGLSVAASMLAARRNAVDGLDLLYGFGDVEESSGTLAVARLGLVKEWSGARSFEAVALHSRTRMTHEVAYTDLHWDPEQQIPVAERRLEANADRANQWGLQLVHARPLTAGWRIGWLAAATRATFPALPRYDTPADGVMNLSSGRGHAEALELGIGVATTDRPVRFGAEVVYEPVRARIRSTADTATTTAAGETIPPGGTTIDNRLLFSNAVARLGIAREWSLDGRDQAITLRAGVATRAVDYRLAQFDRRQGAGRDRDESWVEWTPTWGATLRVSRVEVAYHGSITYGTERPGAAQPTFAPCGFCVAEARSVVIVGPPPRDPSELGPVRIVTQQLVVSLPLGTARQGGER